MSVEIAPIEVVGLKDALKELNNIDKRLRRQITKDFVQIMQPVLDDAKTRIPNEAPLSGMARPWVKNGKQLMLWQPKLVERNLKAFTSVKKIRETPVGFKQNLGVFGLRWAGVQATLFDQARNGNLGRSLSQEFGQASRVVYRAYEKAGDDVQHQVKLLVQKVMHAVNKEFRV